MSLLDPYNDWPDFGTPPAAGGTFYAESAIFAGAFGQVFEQQAGQAQGALYTSFIVGTVGSFYTFQLALNAPSGPTEPPTRTQWTQFEGQVIRIPLALIGSVVELQVIGHDDPSPFTIQYSYATMAGPISRNQMQHQNPTLFETINVPAGNSQAWLPTGISAAEAWIQVATAATAYDVDLEIATVASGWVPVRLGDETTMQNGINITLPVSSWRIVVTNNDAGAQDFLVCVNVRP